METISIKLEKEFTKNIEKVMKNHNYVTKTEFIREAIRDKIIDLETNEALDRARKLYGTGKSRKITDKQLHKAREKAVLEIEKELSD